MWPIGNSVWLWGNGIETARRGCYSPGNCSGYQGIASIASGPPRPLQRSLAGRFAAMVSRPFAARQAPLTWRGAWCMIDTATQPHQTKNPPRGRV